MTLSSPSVPLQFKPKNLLHQHHAIETYEMLSEARKDIHQAQSPRILYKIFIDMTAKLKRRQGKNRVVTKPFAEKIVSAVCCHGYSAGGGPGGGGICCICPSVTSSMSLIVSLTSTASSSPRPMDSATCEIRLSRSTAFSSRIS